MRIQLFGSLMAALGFITSTPAQSSFLIEAEDFDFDGGQYVSAADIMPYTGGAFESVSAVFAVDYFRNTDEPWTDIYRYGEQPNVAMFQSSNPEALDRGSWSSSYNFKLAFLNQSSWYNYTRSFPAGNYRVYAALYDGSPVVTADRLRGKLGIVTGGIGTTAQTIQDLGEFVGTGTGRWDLPAQVMLTSGGMPVIVALNGTTTVRYTSEFGDFDYLFFVPEHAPGATIAANKTQLAAGETLLLSASVIGQAPSSYQWRFNGADIPGATSETLEIPAVGMEHTGHYSLFVANEHGGMISSSLQIKVSFPISIGDTVSPGFPSEGAGVLSEGEQDVYTFHGDAGDQIYIEGLEGDACSGLSIQFIAPNGGFFDSALGFCVELDPHRGLIMPVTGTYSVIVYSRGFYWAPNYSFRIVDLPVGTERTISLGETVEGDSADLTTMDVYEFQVNAAGAVYVEELAGTGCRGSQGHMWAIYDSHGTLLKADPLGPDCNPTTLDPKAVFLATPGTYSIVVVHGIYPEGYGFRLVETSIQTHAIEINSIITPDALSGKGILEGPGATDTFEFQGEIGQNIYFYGRASSDDANVRFVIMGESGGFGVTGSFGSAEFIDNARLYTLPYSGTYRITISSPSDAVGTYSFQFLQSEGIQKFEHVLGETVDIALAPAGYLDGNGAVDEFTMVLPEPGVILSFVDLGSEGENLIFTVEEVVPWPTWPFISEVLDGTSENTLGFYNPGTYRITISSQNGDPSFSGEYSFKTIVHNYPIAVGESNFKTKGGKSVRIPKGKLMSNDYDPDGEEVSWLDFSFDPLFLNGTLVDNGDTLLYTPNLGFLGTAEFSYRIQDPYGLTSAPAAVRIAVE